MSKKLVRFLVVFFLLASSANARVETRSSSRVNEVGRVGVAKRALRAVGMDSFSGTVIGLIFVTEIAVLISFFPLARVAEQETAKELQKAKGDLEQVKASYQYCVKKKKELRDNCFYKS